MIFHRKNCHENSLSQETVSHRKREWNDNENKTLSTPATKTVRPPVYEAVASISVSLPPSIAPAERRCYRFFVCQRTESYVPRQTFSPGAAWPKRVPFVRRLSRFSASFVRVHRVSTFHGRRAFSFPFRSALCSSFRLDDKHSPFFTWLLPSSPTREASLEDVFLLFRASGLSSMFNPPLPRGGTIFISIAIRRSKRQ